MERRKFQGTAGLFELSANSQEQLFLFGVGDQLDTDGETCGGRSHRQGQTRKTG